LTFLKIIDKNYNKIIFLLLFLLPLFRGGKRKEKKMKKS